MSTHAAKAQPENPDMAHTVHTVTFGEKVEVRFDRYFLFYLPEKGAVILTVVYRHVPQVNMSHVCCMCHM